MQATRTISAGETVTYDNSAIIAGTTASRIVWTKSDNGKVRRLYVNTAHVATLSRLEREYAVTKTNGDAGFFAKSRNGLREAINFCLEGS